MKRMLGRFASAACEGDTHTKRIAAPMIHRIGMLLSPGKRLVSRTCCGRDRRTGCFRSAEGHIAEERQPVAHRDAPRGDLAGPVGVGELARVEPPRDAQLALR